MNYDKVHELAREIRESDEFKRYKAAKEAIGEGSSSEAFIAEYRRLRLKAQADIVAGQADEETLTRLQRLGELLQMDKDASEFLLAEFALSRLVGDVYRIVANAAELDISMLE